jgi:hypothetical protein
MAQALYGTSYGQLTEAQIAAKNALADQANLQRNTSLPQFNSNPQSTSTLGRMDYSTNPNGTYVANNTAVTTPQTSPLTLGQLYSPEELQAQQLADKNAQSTYDYNQSQNIGQDAIRAQKTKDMQAAIDASRAIYADQVAKFNRVQAGREGQTRAINYATGQVGSASGQSNDIKTQDYGLEESKALADQQAAKEQSIYTDIANYAEQENARRVAAAQQGADSFVNYLRGVSTAKKSKAQSAIASLVAGGSVPNTSAIAQQLGLPEDIVKQLYQSEKATFDTNQKQLQAEQDKAKLGNAKTQADINKINADIASGDATTVDLGNQIGIYDKKTGKIVNYLPKGLTPIQEDKNAKLTASGATTSELKTNALTSANALLEKFNAGRGTSAVGSSRLLYPFGTIPGTNAKDFEIQYNNLKSLLSLDNIKLLKGQGAVSDSERQLLANASAKLDLAQSEPEFKSALTDIVKSLGGSGTTLPLGGGYTVTDPTGVVHNFPDQKSADAFKKAAGIN